MMSNQNPDELTFTIRDVTVVADPGYTDHDIMALRSLSVPGLDAETVRRNAAFALRQIFSDCPDDWVRGGLIRLNNYDIFPIIATLGDRKEQDPAAKKTIEFIRARQVASGEVEEQEEAGKGFQATGKQRRKPKQSGLDEAKNLEEQARQQEREAEIARLQAQLRALQENA